MLRLEGDGRRGLEAEDGAVGGVELLAARRDGGVEEGGVGGTPCGEEEEDCDGTDETLWSEEVEDGADEGAECCALFTSTAGPALCCVSLPHV
jgi:hypothetical protein